MRIEHGSTSTRCVRRLWLTLSRCKRLCRPFAPRNSKCERVFDHRDHKERREATNLRLICHFFVFSVLFVVEYVLHLELLYKS